MGVIKCLPQVDGDLGWYLTAANVKQSIGRPLKGQQRADIVVLGAGFTGLSAAQRLKELYPNQTIAVVEALDVGQGTSGRNAGFIIDLPHNVDAQENTPEQDAHIRRLNAFAIERLQNWREQFQIDCLWHQAGKYLVAKETANLAGLDAFEASLQKRQDAYQRFKRDALAARLGTDYYQEGIFTPGNILMNPAALVRGIALGLQEHIDFYTRSPIIHIEYGDEIKLHTVGGVLHAKKMVQCTSSFTDVSALTKNTIAPVFTYGSLTDPLPEHLWQKHFHHIQPWGVTSAHPAGTTVRWTPDRRILVRNILEFNPSQHSSEQQRQQAWQQHRASFEARFPFLKQVDFQYTWGGVLAVTMNYQSVFAQPQDNVYVICGCNGVGVAKGTYLGYYMAEMMHGNNSEALEFIRQTSQPTKVPPEPFRSLGAKWRIHKEQQTAGLDI
ncbi:NAD(P)/FAD-dependent oxidoreductase [Vitreoscilla stercoraria]|uniref:FAD-binding oxidoreductase n=1 Tax=Vitreoscilla stercoraria TaxID=61 RepID=A0ABY4EBS9_VITST|nr:FAD-binding oxidoreductase [Vitreoscilla stercoraria]UOO93204.1 FAD-binding oxidoreductase [Vitreoscilla stercoraria]